MRHRIDPKVDCVFKAIFGKNENRNLLVHFLNAVLEPDQGSRIKNVVIENPYNEREFVGDRLAVVDVKATDQNGKKYQVEIQMALHPALASRILFTWSGIYRSLIGEGGDYGTLKPVISVWILNGNLFPGIEKCHLPFTIYSPDHRVALTDHLSIHILQLPQWQYDGTIKTEKDRWLYLFREGQNADAKNPPQPLDTKEMRQVMKVMNQFSESQRNWLMYQSRLDAILTRNTIQREHERAIEAYEREREAYERERETYERQREAYKRERETNKRKIEKFEKTIEKFERKLETANTRSVLTEKQFNALCMLMKEKGIEFPLEDNK